MEWCPELAFSEKDYQRYWFHDNLHNYQPITPMGASLYHWPWGTQYAADYFTFPYSRGFELTLYDGRIYPGVMPIFDPEEIKAKEPVFMQMLMEKLDNWPQFYKEGTDELSTNLGYLKNLDKKSLPLNRLIDVLRDTELIHRRAYELHFIYMYSSFFGYMFFEGVCKKHNIEEKQMSIFLQGFDQKMAEVDRALWSLADLANELGIVGLLNQVSNCEDLDKILSADAKGQQWLQKFRAFLETYGRRTTAAVLDQYYKTWIEDPMPPFQTIQSYILKGHFDFETHTKKIIKDREDAVAQTLEKLGAEDKEEFLRTLKHAQWSYPFNDDHNFYIEQWSEAEARFTLLECGRRLVEWGFFDDVQDVFFMTIRELEEVLKDVLHNEPVGILFHKGRVRTMVERRRISFDKMSKVSPPAIVGTLPDGKIDDPIFTKIWGLTDEVIRATKKEDTNPNRFEGYAGAPGVVEGIARVILGADGFAEVQPGELLVAPFTSPAWTPLFSKIKGVVTDSGGMLSHSAICAREYDIPAVVGCITRGKKVTEGIKNGQRIRIDGLNGVVEIIS